MKIYNFDKEIREKGYMQVTSPNLFTAQGTPDPDGLVSNVIFGITPLDRQDRYGYIDLGERFLHPLIYKRVLKRSWRDIDGLLSGTERYSISEKGELIPDEKGGTGIKWLYDNFEKIKFKNIDIIDEDEASDVDSSLFKQDVRTLFKKNDKMTLFPNKLMVIPVAFRDVDIRDSVMGIDTLNGLYRNILNKCRILKENKEVVLFDQNKIRFQIQLQLCAVSDHLKGINFGKRGLQRKRALSKNVDFGSIIVLSAREFRSDSFEDDAIGIDKTGFPLTSVVANCHLFINRRVQSFLIGLPMMDKKGNEISLVDKELYYDSERIREYNDIYEHSVSERFTKIKNPKEDGYVMFNYTENGEEKSRPLTITDLMYMFAYTEMELTERHAMITRHPTMDSFNIIPTLIHVESTIRTKHIQAYGIDFPYYPDIDYILNSFNLDDTDEAIEAERVISGYFVESQKMSSLQFVGMNADLDGDKNIVRYVFSNEANEECRQQMQKITSAFDMKLSNVKILGNDSAQTLYSFTAFVKGAKMANKEAVKKIHEIEPKDISVSWLFKELRLADTTKFTKLNDVHDLINLLPGEYGTSSKEGSQCTIGQLILWKLLFMECKIPLMNEPWTGKVMDKVFNQVGQNIKDGIIDMDTYKRMENRYESFSMRIGSFINPSISPSMLCLTPEILELKGKLLKENEEALKNNDIVVAGEIEDKLLDAVKQTYKDDPAFELMASGVAKLGNTFKTMAVMQGAMPQDTQFNKFQVVTNSLNEGTPKTDMTYVSNTAVVGGYSRGKGPEEGGALAKTANYVYQTIMIDKHGTDCGTKVYPEIEIRAEYATSYLGRYIVEGNSLVLITKDNLAKYTGKKVKMRSVLTCKSKNICSKCAGEFIYEMYDIYDKPIAFGLKLNKQQHELVQKRLKLSHDVTVHFKSLDFNNFVPSDKKEK